MVPHLGVETALREVLAADDQEVQLAVTAVHDPTRGERLVVLHTGFGMSAAEICRRMVARGLPPLWVPSPDSFREVPAIPLLGTGKLDLGGLQALARAEFGCEVAVAQR
jgi:acyl-[acyl-carrier-protein]-phospholipid O-acyltransferase/long-chain-fatty-acid--[acyl-carrier-protein] ligase